jgi:hypothetical protein
MLEATILRELRGLPFVVFEEESADDLGEVIFGNQRQFADAMGLPVGVLPTEQQARSWATAQAGAIFEKYRDRLAAAYCVTRRR